jgi:hypothetical protein
MRSVKTIKSGAQDLEEYYTEDESLKKEEYYSEEELESSEHVTIQGVLLGTGNREGGI